MLTLETTSRFRKDLRVCEKRRYELSLLRAVLETLREEKPLDARFRDHALTGNYSECRECHILPDWLLIYRIDHDRLILIAQRTGTHADLFR